MAAFVWSRWLVAMVYHAVADLAEELGPGHSGEHVRTLRCKFFNRPGPRLVESLEILAEILHPDVFHPSDGAPALPICAFNAIRTADASGRIAMATPRSRIAGPTTSPVHSPSELRNAPPRLSRIAAA